MITWRRRRRLSDFQVIPHAGDDSRREVFCGARARGREAATGKLVGEQQEGRVDRGMAEAEVGNGRALGRVERAEAGAGAAAGIGDWVEGRSSDLRSGLSTAVRGPRKTKWN